MTSHDVMDIVRRSLGTRRVGHTGTLDPLATGLLIVLVGRATRLSTYLLGLPKSYEGTIALGATTPTDDSEGEVTIVDSDTKDIRDNTVAEAMASFVGSYSQVPPSFSAKKVGGEAAHRRVRRGESVALEPVEVEIDRFQMVARRGELVDFSVDVGSGTYIRALARDLGRRLGCGAYLASLRRTRVGGFSVSNAVPPDRLTSRDLGAMAEVLQHIPQISLAREEVETVKHGRPVVRTELGEGPVALMDGGELAAVGESDGESIKPKVVFS